MKDQTSRIEQKAISFIKELSQITGLEIKLKNPKIWDEKFTILEYINYNLIEEIILFDISLDVKVEIIGGWDRIDYSQFLGSYIDDWININYATGEIEVHNPDYYYLDLFYKIAKNDEHFLMCCLELAREFKKINTLKGAYEGNIKEFYALYKRRALAEKYTHIAGGEPYYRFWEVYWVAWSDQEIFEAGLLGYGLDLPDTIILIDGKYQWVTEIK